MKPNEIAIRILRDPDAYALFQTIVSQRSIRLKDLCDRALVEEGWRSKYVDPEELRNKLLIVLETLKKEQLIEEHPAPIQDFTIYNPTMAGLSVDRALGVLGSKL